MDHDEVKNRFSELLDEDLPESEARKIRGHLDECRECQRAWDEFRKTFKSFRHVAPSEAPPYLVDHVKKKIRRRSRGRFYEDQAPLLYRVPYEAFSLIIIIIALMMFMLLSGLSIVAFDDISKDADIDTIEEIMDKME